MIKKLKNLTNSISIIFLPIICGVMGAMSGSDNSNKSYRRVFIPCLLFGFAFIQLENIYTISILLLMPILSMGYGIPDSNDPKPSLLGKYWYDKFKNETKANIFTRGTIGVLECVSFLSIPILQGNWFTYIWCSLGIIFVNSFISWQSLGQYTLLGKKLNWSETILYFSISLFGVLMVGIK